MDDEKEYCYIDLKIWKYVLDSTSDSLGMMELTIALLATLAAFPRTTIAYRRPAPPAAIKPLQNHAFANWFPHPQLGSFTARNGSIQPANPYPPGYDGQFPPRSGCSIQHPSPQQSFWLPNVPHQGTSPFLVNGTHYRVYRNVKDFGAKGDGMSDDTAAFTAAINAGGRCSGGTCGTGTTGQPALIYVPQGTYIISSPIQLYVDTQVIGDAINLPTLEASPAFSPSNGSVIAGFDPGQGSTTNFYIGVHNLNIDTTRVSANSTISGLNWAVSQATNLIYVNFVLAPNSQHTGIEMNGGSGGGGSGTFLGDLTFTGGLIGIALNNQQYAFKNITFTSVATGIAIQHVFVATFQQMHFEDCGIAVDAGGAGTAGSVSLIDSTANDCGIVVNGSSSFLLENVRATNSGPLLFVNGTSKISSTSLEGRTFVVGDVYKNNDGVPVQSAGSYLAYTNRGALTDNNGFYLTKSQPQYTEYSADAFVSVKNVGARGDGQTDDTAAINAALKSNAGCKITYFPHGVYLVTDTIHVPPGSRIVGEVWSTISASGKAFADEKNPHVMFQVGNPGDVGVAEISDMLFTVADVLPGAILVEVNMAGAQKGDVSFHNSHYRVGGAADSRTETACQTTVFQTVNLYESLTSISPSSQTYIENAWLWSADHDLDGSYNQVIGTGRGMFIESTQGTWLVGTASEHHILYAYQLYNAQNVFTSMQQVETPYFQPVPTAPTPWTPNGTWHDPSFAGCAKNASDAQCRMQWSLRVLGEETNTINIYGTGFWVFFNNYSTDCGNNNGNCQQSNLDLEHLPGHGNVNLYNLNVRSVEEMVTIGGSDGFPAAKRVDNPGSWGGVLAAYLGFA